ncbi:MAG: Uma2 family endonuclease [Gemmataceae bacterium]|nr:Uma2 family endonuclease [Gemmataceae bacterium]
MAILELPEREPAPLGNGDKLTREEFLRRWEMHPEIKRAELIGGIVYMPSPVSHDHGPLEDDVGGWLVNYRVQTPGTGSSSNETTCLLDDAPQPDRHLRILTECGGKSWLEGKYLHGAPELMVEICVSSVSYDLNQKFDLYEAAGVAEYLAVLRREQEIRWHVLDNGRFHILAADDDGIWRSRVFPGLWLDGAALFEGDMQKALAVLQDGIQTKEHRAFVERLAAKRTTK